MIRRRHWVLLFLALLCLPAAARTDDDHAFPASVVQIVVGLRVPETPMGLLTDELISFSEILHKHTDGFLPLHSGSGFIISEAGHIVTNAHVSWTPQHEWAIDQLRLSWLFENRLVFGDEQEEPELFRMFARLLADAWFEYIVFSPMFGTYRAVYRNSFASEDIALMQLLDEFPFEPLPIATYVELKPGDPVWAYGFPANLFVLSSEGFLEPVVESGVVTDGQGDGSDISHDAAIRPGFSGGPLIDRHGQVVGVNYRLSEEWPSAGLAIPASLILHRLSTFGLPELVEENAARSLRYGTVSGESADMPEVLHPALRRRTGDLIIEADRKVREVILERRPLGPAPAVAHDVPVGTYNVFVDGPGVHRGPYSVAVDEGSNQVLPDLEPGSRVTFDVPLAARIELNVPATGEWIPTDRSVFLRAGDYEARVVHPDFWNRPLRFTVPVQEPVDFASRLRTGTLRVDGLDETMRVWINGREQPARTGQLRLDLPVGTYEVRVLQSNGKSSTYVVRFDATRGALLQVVREMQTRKR